jgi:WD40 repeat protein
LIDTVYHIAFSPDGKFLASGSNNAAIGLWNATTGSLIGDLTGHTSYVTAVAFSTTMPLLASASADTTIRLWHIATGSLYRIINAQLDRVDKVVFSPDGRFLASTSSKACCVTPVDCTIRLWDPITGDLKHCLEGHSGAIEALVFSGDSQLLASGSCDCTIRIWDTGAGIPLSALEGHPKIGEHPKYELPGISKVAFSPNSRLIASVSYGAASSVRIWNTQSELVAELNSKEAVHELSNSTHDLYLNTINGLQEFSCLYDPIISLRRNFM